ncbi:hypothetical protein GW7_21040 [Heterocephalus glaber]|uniref:Beclin 1-associated autophagy-related key regulator n=1 Tax=Heterocephalus glaber TaxID=10181 RepID=G5BFG5_HETGA|nr:hypothetical protein GW7_21040 [Heterocephalus glaber]
MQSWRLTLPAVGPPPLVRDLVDSLDDAEGLYVAVERCPLSNTTHRRLTCAECIQSGDLVYLDGRDRERFIDKKERLKRFKSKQEKFQKEVLKAMEGKWVTYQLRWKIMTCKMRIEQLKQTICKGNEEMKKNSESLLKTKEKNQNFMVDTRVSITGPWISLPNNGNYSAYYSWVEEKKTMQGPDMEHTNPADTISAALCSATQLVNILSHILDVSPPKKLCNSEFYGENLSKQKFTQAVKKLNTNILYLCFSQHVNLDQLQPLHTLRNLMYLVTSSSEHLGRSGPFEVRADLEESMEFVDPGVAGESDESGDEDISNEETDLGTDWENLPSPRFCDIPSQPEISQSRSTQVSPPISSSSAGGMISSAAASVTSWFKAYTGHR